MVAGRPSMGLWVSQNSGGTEWVVHSVTAAFNRLQPDPAQLAIGKTVILLTLSFHHY